MIARERFISPEKIASTIKRLVSDEVTEAQISVISNSDEESDGDKTNKKDNELKMGIKLVEKLRDLIQTNSKQNDQTSQLESSPL